MIARDRFGKLCKEHMVNEVLARFNERPNFFITSYMGLAVSDLESLRRNLKKTSSVYFVVKNSILKVVLEKLQLQSEISKIDSGMGISLSGGDIISACKTLASFAKDHEKFNIKGAVIDGKILSADRVGVLSCLPPKEMLLAQVVGGIKAPITGFVNTLSGVLRKFILVVDAIKASKEGLAQVSSAPADPKS